MNKLERIYYECIRCKIVYKYKPSVCPCGCDKYKII